MSDLDYRTFIGWVYIPPAANGQPYSRTLKSGQEIKTFLISVPALNGRDKTVKAEFWDGIPECMKDRAAVMINGKYSVYQPEDGEPSYSVNVSRLVPLGDDVMQGIKAPAKAPAKKRAPAPEVDTDLDELFA